MHGGYLTREPGWRSSIILRCDHGDASHFSALYFDVKSFRMNTRPTIVAHADWSVAPAKRWLALAAPDAGAYRAQPAQPVGDPQTLLSRLRSQARKASDKR